MRKISSNHVDPDDRPWFIDVKVKSWNMHWVKTTWPKQQMNANFPAMANHSNRKFIRNQWLRFRLRCRRSFILTAFEWVHHECVMWYYPEGFNLVFNTISFQHLNYRTESGISMHRHASSDAGVVVFPLQRNPSEVLNIQGTSKCAHTLNNLFIIFL